MTKAGTLLTAIGLVISAIWFALWPIGREQLDPTADPAGLVVASLGFGALFAAVLVGPTLTFAPEGRRFVARMHEWRNGTGDLLPAVHARSAARDVDISTVLATHRFSSAVYLTYAITASIGAGVSAIPALGWVWWSRSQASDAENASFGLALLIGMYVVILPAVVATVLWVTLHWRRHRVEIHPDGITVVNATTVRTFANSTDTLIHFTGEESLMFVTVIVDRVTGQRAYTWMLGTEGDSAVQTCLSHAVRVHEPRADVLPLMPFAVRQPVLMIAALTWCICAVGFWAVLITY